MLIHLIYASAASRGMERTELLELLEQSRRKNRELDVTGMLLYAESSFFQVIEGEERVIDELFDVIGRDERHDRVTTIIREPIPERSFGGWSMGFAGATPGQLERIDGLNDFFTEGRCLADLDRGRARKLLEAFSAGRWRRALE